MAHLNAVTLFNGHCDANRQCQVQHKQLADKTLRGLYRFSIFDDCVCVVCPVIYLWWRQPHDYISRQFSTTSIFLAITPVSIYFLARKKFFFRLHYYKLATIQSNEKKILRAHRSVPNNQRSSQTAVALTECILRKIIFPNNSNFISKMKQ